MTTLDNQRRILEARIEHLQDEMDALGARLDRLKAERAELDEFVPAVDPDTGEVS